MYQLKIMPNLNAGWNSIQRVCTKSKKFLTFPTVFMCELYLNKAQLTMPSVQNYNSINAICLNFKFEKLICAVNIFKVLWLRLNRN